MKLKRVLFIKSVTKSDSVTQKDWKMLQDGVADGISHSALVEVSTFSELVFLADGKNTRIIHAHKGYDVADFDMVVFRRVGDEIEKAISVAHYLSSKRVPFIDKYLLTQGKGKLAGVFMRVANNIPVPKTLFASSDVFYDTFQSLTPFEYPFVLKADNGSKGRDNYLITDAKSLKDTLAKSADMDMVAQEFIRNDGDYRLLLLNGRVSLVIHRKGAEGSHLNNTSQGGIAKLIDPSELPKQIIIDAQKAAELENLQVAGADVVVDNLTGKHYFLEVNRAPQLATGAFTDEKISAYSTMVKELLEGSDVGGKEKTLVGRVEIVKFPGLGNSALRARIDTGAKTSSIWAQNVKETPEGLLVRFASPSHDIYQHEQLFRHYDRVSIASSMGMIQVRYKVRIPVIIKKRRIMATFTLADRSTQVYPILIGRSTLLGKFLVDVSKGSPLLEEEKRRSEELQSLIEEDHL